MERKIRYQKVPLPVLDHVPDFVSLTDATMNERKQRVLDQMKEQNLDTLVIYNDLEHQGNFAYLTGFATRFEEGVLVLHHSGEAYLILGNENLKMVNHARIDAKLLHCPLFSLPNQPLDGELDLTQLFVETGLDEKSRVGIVGWKLFAEQQLFDVPHFIVQAIKEIVTQGVVRNATDVFISPVYGVRTRNNVNELAHYEFGSALASDCVLSAIQTIEPGKTEMDVAQKLVAYGQRPTIMPIAATGERFTHAEIWPRAKKIRKGDKFSVTTGFIGGLASRSGYVVNETSELPEGQQDYFEKIAQPYYRAVVAWLETVAIGKTGGDIYQEIEEVLPKETYHWTLNPGHLTAEEEWLSSPITPGSKALLQSGMLLQLDIIPSVAGYAGASCENGIALADETLQAELAETYPALWNRITTRRHYMKEILGIELPDSVLPLSSGVGFYTPYFLAKDQAFIVEK
ncbi:MAG: M24 family metallopeptidase [Enterococcus sp.]